MIRKEYIFYGRVQGVGFRYKCYSIARRLGLTGWVKNQYDYSVKAEVQGDEYAIEKMLEALFQEPFISIESINSQVIAVKENESSFEIKF